jgi:hypothetical protein
VWCDEKWAKKKQENRLSVGWKDGKKKVGGSVREHLTLDMGKKSQKWTSRCRVNKKRNRHTKSAIMD